MHACQDSFSVCFAEMKATVGALRVCSISVSGMPCLTVIREWGCGHITDPVRRRLRPDCQSNVSLRERADS